MSGLNMKVVEEIFQMCDADGDGKLKFSEFSQGFKKWFKKQGSDVPAHLALQQMFSGMNTDKDQYVTKQEFVKQLVQSKDRKTGLMEDFKKADTQGGGDGLSREEFKAFVLKYKVTSMDNVDEFVEEQFKQSDKDRSGRLCFNEFKEFMDSFFQQ